MKNFLITLTVICAVVSFAMPLCCDEFTEQGYTSLFNGKDLSGWVIPEGDNGHWKVVDGVIDYDARSEAKGNKNLLTEKSFGDYQLHIEWRLKKTVGLHNMHLIQEDGSYVKDAWGKVIDVPSPNADSGVFLRGTGNTQINIWCWPVGSGEMWSVRRNGNLSAEDRAAAVPLVKADKPVGEWNAFDVTVKGDRATVKLNGFLVIDNARVPGLEKEGPIALQHHGGFNEKTGEYSPASSLIQFRNIYIKEI